MKPLEYDRRHLADILRQTQKLAEQFLNDLPDHPVTQQPHSQGYYALPEQGVSAKQALELFMKRYGAGLSASSGGRY